MITRTFIAISPKEEDMYVAECPEVGIDQGASIAVAIAKLKEATRLYLEEFSL